MFQFDILTIFPEMFDCYFNESIIKRAQKKKLIKIRIHNIRRWAYDKHHTVDGRPYGGGPGMILKVEPIYYALKSLGVLKIKNKKQKAKTKIVMLDPSGKQFDQQLAQKFSKLKRLVLLCGRYEGFDYRITKFVDERISIGRYVLTGGELPAMVIVDVISRLIPGVIGKKESLLEETFVKKGYIEYPQYTRPENFMGYKVPRVLLSGNHKKIAEWRKKHAKF
jgi:tRNA (guanine37-N1)-methyltransferase